MPLKHFRFFFQRLPRGHARKPSALSYFFGAMFFRLWAPHVLTAQIRDALLRAHEMACPSVRVACGRHVFIFRAFALPYITGFRRARGQQPQICSPKHFKYYSAETEKQTRATCRKNMGRGGSGPRRGGEAGEMPDILFNNKRSSSGARRV